MSRALPSPGLLWAPGGILSTGASFPLRAVERFQGTRVEVVEGCGLDGHGIVRTITYWFDENDHLLARYDPMDEIDTARGPNDAPIAERSPGASE